MKTANEQAFPCINPKFDGNWNKEPVVEGLTKLEYFSGLAMQGLCANQIIIDPDSDHQHTPKMVAEDAISTAKALLKELECEK